MNKVILMGSLGKDVELKHSPKGSAYTKLSVATSENKKKEDGTWESVAEWHNVMIFGKRAEKVADCLKKGSKVYIEGKIQTTKNEDKYYTSILCDKIESLDFMNHKASANKSESGTVYDKVEPDKSFVSDDIPF